MASQFVVEHNIEGLNCARGIVFGTLIFDISFSLETGNDDKGVRGDVRSMFS